MENLFNITLQNRKILHDFLTNTSRKQLLEIPDGYRNNIWWNIAHIVVTHQLLVYNLSKIKMRIPEELVNKFRKGTVPDGNASDEDINAIAAFLFSTEEWAREDYENGLFKEFTEYTTSNNVTLRNINDAIAYNIFHEGLHLGVILSLQKALRKTGNN